MTPPLDSPLVVHVVSHTHWDREWYHPVGRFRQRLVALIDALLDDTEDDAPFLLDGQAIVLEDYLDVRPERRALLAARLRAGSLEAGPWYVLADELIPSGESLVRNLLAGRAMLDALGATAPAVLYSPDAFGHPAMLPAIAAGFGMPVIVLWRGYGGAHHPAGDVARWRAPDGSSALIYHLTPDGYELGASLPVSLQQARERWDALRAVLQPRATLGEVLLPNGADHHARQAQRVEAVRALAAVAAQAEVQLTSLGAFGRAIAAAAERVRIPEVEGELRDSYGYTWTLQGTFATRSSLKRRAARAERSLLRDTEPWVALADWMHGARRGPLMRAAWRTLLKCQPHDTLCGCSVDAVARAMAARLEDVEVQATGLRQDAMLDLIAHDVVAARAEPARWKPSILVRNPAARARGGVAEVDVQVVREHVRVGPGSGGGAAMPAAAPSPGWSLDGGAVPVQPIVRDRRHDRVESPLDYPWDDMVEATRALVWVPPIAGYGTRSLAISDGASATPPPPPGHVRVGERWMENDTLRVAVDESGAIRLSTTDGTRAISPLLSMESVIDRGDLYTPSPRGEPRRLEIGRPSMTMKGPLRATLMLPCALSLEDELPLPRANAEAHARGPSQEVFALLHLSLDAGSSFLRVHVNASNHLFDHRLRLRIATDVTDAKVFADAAFGPVRREAIVAPRGSAELPPPTAPLARFVTLDSSDRGATIYSDGCGEYEVFPDGTVALTLLRAVGELSRNDLPERPGHAGWPAATPEAQEQGELWAAFAILLHGPRNDETIAEIERVAEDVLHPLAGRTIRSTLALPAATAGVTLDGAGLALSAIKTSEDGEWMVLRCVNLTDREVAGAWVLGAPVQEARASRLDETPGESIAIRDRSVPIVAAPRAIVTTLVR